MGSKPARVKNQTKSAQASKVVAKVRELLKQSAASLKKNISAVEVLVKKEAEVDKKLQKALKDAGEKQVLKTRG
jgi:hypothetical protein